MINEIQADVKLVLKSVGKLMEKKEFCIEKSLFYLADNNIEYLITNFI